MADDKQISDGELNSFLGSLIQSNSKGKTSETNTKPIDFSVRNSDVPVGLLPDRPRPAIAPLVPEVMTEAEFLGNDQLKMPAIKADIVAGPVALSNQQKNNICIIAYALAIKNLAFEPDKIYHLWPIEGDPYKLARAGRRPSITGIQQFMATDEFAMNMGERGIETKPQSGLLPEQVALISILSDTTSQLGIRQRLKKAGITWAVYNGWRRQKQFADALSAATGSSLSDAVSQSDVQLAQLAQNGDLKAIVYLNEMIGRGPNNRKAVDAIQFARIVLEAVQKHVNPEQARAISSEIELASQQLGLRD